MRKKNVSTQLNTNGKHSNITFRAGITYSRENVFYDYDMGTRNVRVGLTFVLTTPFQARIKIIILLNVRRNSFPWLRYEMRYHMTLIKNVDYIQELNHGSIIPNFKSWGGDVNCQVPFAEDGAGFRGPSQGR